MNLPLPGKEPAIDDVDAMQSLYEKVTNDVGDMEGIARAFLAVSFFELDGPLVRDGPLYTCYGSILSRSPDCRALVARLNNTYP